MKRGWKVKGRRSKKNERDGARYEVIILTYINEINIDYRINI